MAFTAGDFSPSVIGAIKVAEADLLQTPRSLGDINKDITAGAAILMHQDPTIVTIGAGEACMNADIYVQRSGSLDKGSKTISCDITAGVKGATEKISLTKEILVNVEKFTVDNTFCANAESYAKQLAYLKLKAMINLELKLSKFLVGKLNTGIDKITADMFEVAGTVVDDNIYEVAKVNFTGDLLADLQWNVKAGGFADPKILNGRNFFNKSIMEQYASVGCCTNDAILNRNQVFDIVWDSFAVDSTTTKKTTFLFDKNSLLFWSSPSFANIGMQNMIQESNDIVHWVETLPRLQYFAGGSLQPIYVDIRGARTCVVDSLGIPRDSWTYEMWLTGAATLNLTNDDTTNGNTNGKHGIIRIDQVEGA